MGEKSRSTSRKCQYVKSDGSRCGAHSRLGSLHCFFHDADSAGARNAARKAGGIERSRRAAVLPADTPDKQLKRTADVAELLAESINQVRKGQIDPRVSNAIAGLASILLKAQSGAEIEARVARLEAILARQKDDSTTQLQDSADFETALTNLEPELTEEEQ